MNKLQQSSCLIWEVCSLLVPAEPSRGGSHLTQLPCGTHILTNVVFWRNFPKIFLPLELWCVNGPDPSSRRFIYFQVSPATPGQSRVKMTEKCSLCKYKQSSSFILHFTLQCLSVVWLANNIFLIIHHLQKQNHFLL